MSATRPGAGATGPSGRAGFSRAAAAAGAPDMDRAIAESVSGIVGRGSSGERLAIRTQ
jgi:hypothetical protein